MSDDPVEYVVENKPCLVSLEEGKKYAWCTCKLSKTQPFCDGAHKGTEHRPMVFKAEKTEDVLLCACKATKSGPYCDGAHNNLEDVYAEASDAEILSMKDSVQIDQDANGKALVDGGAYVMTPNDKNDTVVGNLRYQPVIAKEDGATKLSLHRLTVSAGTTKWMEYEGVDTVLYFVSGAGTVDIAGREFNVDKEAGLYVRPGEKFRVITDEEMVIYATACPLLTDLTVTDDNETTFQTEQEERYIAFDEATANVMANRIYQELVDKKVGSNEVTQFIGQIPKSRAAMHRHLYEEAIVILTGYGKMWTGTKVTEVKTGDVLFLPHRQGHSVECTDEGGMQLMGVFYPSGSPAINY
ncbi:CDGSH iron-sulfur domain-containing protein [Pseudemcibacter aquimaris]|uniref:CDGSH iron-sulfur domain-containing protein n=1 Tax=Pseudemcibacter aquimaris TaxID=2857064 RepID=UPI0020133CD9|nr:CDGSH iron-sulfur domain-containing protein [Pseudemcibacter aquimaris]MCC3861551.1 CDGSH iron-sulfur domain-containing protein [Pseudemcibacter aquimaris]WDU58320.1 CDGSH iron-sulfur domain-containing protein [Pseudemcibacter aquimaris]